MHTETITIRLIPQSCGNWSGASVSNPSNALTNVDSDTFATITGNGEAYISKFDYSQIPTDATVQSFYFRIKGESTSADVGAVGIFYCYNGSDYSGVSGWNKLGDSAHVLTINTTNTYNWANFIEYAPNYSPQLRIQPSGETLKIYGAELDVVCEHEVPDTHGIFNLILPR